MSNRAAVDLTKQLTEEQFGAVYSDIVGLAQTPGWALVLQLVAGAKTSIVQMIHDPAVHKEYVSGMLQAIDSIPNTVALILDRGQALAKQKADEREAAAQTKRLPFVKPGSSTPAM